MEITEITIKLSWIINILIIIGIIFLIKYFMNNFYLLPQIFNPVYYLKRYNYKIYKRELSTQNVYIIKLYNKLNIHIGYLSLGGVRTEYNNKTKEFVFHIGYWNKEKAIVENAIDCKFHNYDYYYKTKEEMFLPDNFDDILDSKVREIVNDYNISTENEIMLNYKLISKK